MPTTSLLSGLTVDGIIRGSADLRIEGNVIGIVEVEGNVHIAETGDVEADIKGQTINLEGHFHGKAWGKESIEIKKSGDVSGAFLTPSLLVETGARLSGDVSMDESADWETLFLASDERKEETPDEYYQQGDFPEVSFQETPSPEIDELAEEAPLEDYLASIELDLASEFPKQDYHGHEDSMDEQYPSMPQAGKDYTTDTEQFNTDDFQSDVFQSDVFQSESTTDSYTNNDRSRPLKKGRSKGGQKSKRFRLAK